MQSTGKENLMKRYLAIAAAVLVAGCGGEERLTKTETAAKLNGAVQTVDAEFQQVFERLGQSREDARVSAAIRRRLASAAASERRAVEAFEGVKPVEGAEPAIADFVRAARLQADRLEDAAARPDLTVAEMADAIELPEMRDALGELVRRGLAEAPPHR